MYILLWTEDNIVSIEHHIMCRSDYFCRKDCKQKVISLIFHFQKQVSKGVNAKLYLQGMHIATMLSLLPNLIYSSDCMAVTSLHD